MRKKVAVVGATGIAGQQFLAALDGHPWFEVTALAASERSAGKTYAEAIRDPKSGARRWWCAEEPSAAVLGLPVQNGQKLDPTSVDIIFSAVESDAARELEPLYARTTAVVSTASAFRYEDDVPIMVPGVNFEHARLIELQRKNRGWKGFVTPLPNCTTMGMVITLKPLLDAFGIERVFMTSMQGISGAGRSPGVFALDIVDNVIPFISGEEEKVARETGKVLGTMGEGGIRNAPIKVSATCTRAAVLEGHTEAVVVSTKKPCSPE
jgi:aspartate-semialdehyde dehydrogenase